MPICDWHTTASEYVILTKDKNIRRDSLELEVVIRERARYFVLGRAHRKAAANAAIVLRHRKKIIEIVGTNEPPVIAQLNQDHVLLRSPDGKLVPFKRRPA